MELNCCSYEGTQLKLLNVLYFLGPVGFGIHPSTHRIGGWKGRGQFWCAKFFFVISCRKQRETALQVVPSCPDPTTHQHLPQLTNLKKQPFLWQTPSAGLNCSTSTSATPKQSSGGNPASSTSPSQEGTHRKVQHSLRAQCGEQNLCRVDGTV